MEITRSVHDNFGVAFSLPDSEHQLLQGEHLVAFWGIIATKVELFRPKWWMSGCEKRIFANISPLNHGIFQTERSPVIKDELKFEEPLSSVLDCNSSLMDNIKQMLRLFDDGRKLKLLN